ncbi:MAG: DUF547 domain-containing protein, partial [Pseudomonadota bacterium]
MHTLRAPFTGFAALGAAALVAAVPAATPAAAVDTGFATFAPGEKTSSASIDYEIWNEATQNLVISMGPSLRQTPGRPPAGFGTLRQYGHTSRYRLEGSRVSFSFLDETIRSNIANYRQDLQAIADKV